ncbi:hypothetical protein CEXT_256601 [Caerostris extrusa]|uniref:Uncharacterized protein n=1 Tax=Caerostris extrusa TaxID=172846 RepID=A0AAV4RAI7_CAEEX|nr:hypothetical protein CEXT_256601 [Caerostris extrusa]
MIFSYIKLVKNYLVLVSDVSKKSSLDSELKYATIHELFPDDSWPHVYTDGSPEGTIRNARARVYSIDFTSSYVIGSVMTTSMVK